MREIAGSMNPFSRALRCTWLGAAALATAIGSVPTIAQDPLPSAWARLADLPKPQAFPAQTPQGLDAHWLLLAGASYRIDTLLSYSPDTDSWSARPTALITSRHHFATAATGGRLYVAGGCLGESDSVPHRRTAAVECYDPSTGLWAPKSSMITARQGFALVPFGERLYAIGGTDGANDSISTIEIYAPAEDRWEQVEAPWHHALGWAHASVYRNTILVIGGIKDTTLFAAYDPLTNTAVNHPIGPLPELRNYGLALVGDALVLVGGGQKTPSARVVAYDLPRGEWRELPSLPAPRGHAGVAAAGDRVLCIGGWGPEWDWAHPNATVFALDLADRRPTTP